jgi:[acyl-carrier-protein] S-malonyltransferase
MKRVFLFPGQGSQSIGMLSEFVAEHLIVRNTFTEASEALGYDLLDVIQSGPVDVLNATEVTQPALLTASIALWRLWLSQNGPIPDYFAGHSLGEYSAMVAAEVIEFGDAVRLVRKRGELMQAAVPASEGAMAAVIGLTDEQVVQACAEAAPDFCVPVNYNAPGQVVIAGRPEGVQRAGDIAKSLGAKRILPLSVSAPSHCELMRPAAELLAQELAMIDFRRPSAPIVQNVDAMAYSDVDILRTNLVEQLYRPVLWVKTIQNLVQGHVSHGVECGPGKVLGGLVKRIDQSLTVQSMTTLEEFHAALTTSHSDV